MPHPTNLFCFGTVNLLYETIKKNKGAEVVGVKITVFKSMDKLSGKVLFPEKLKTTNKIIGKLKMS
ncbi:MAG: hypothetical protein ABIU77_21570 [Ferruginibacter sp.]